MRGGSRRSPGHYRGSQSPNIGYERSENNGQGGSMRDQHSSNDNSKVERREMLQREADRMREALKAKERELEELGMVD